VQAVVAGGLAGALEGPGPLTVFVSAAGGERAALHRHLLRAELRALYPGPARTPPSFASPSITPHPHPPLPPCVQAPDNFAFERLGRNVLDYVLNPHNKAALVDVLTYHVANGEIKAGSLKNGQVIPTLDAGQSVTVGINGGIVTINGARVIRADVGASNG
jgi:uncharacterized surface protein with fasciclin (FAS1) repeats